RAICFGAVLLYQYLPISAQHLSDGISEPVFLVMLVSALWQAVHAVRERSVWRCQLCGLFTGLAYLTRPEGLLILPAFGGALLMTQLFPSWRGTWRQFFECGLSMATTAALVGAIYVGTTGQISNKPVVRVMTHQTEVSMIDHGGHYLFAATF